MGVGTAAARPGHWGALLGWMCRCSASEQPCPPLLWVPPLCSPCRLLFGGGGQSPQACSGSQAPGLLLPRGPRPLRESSSWKHPESPSWPLTQSGCTSPCPPNPKSHDSGGPYSPGHEGNPTRLCLGIAVVSRGPRDSVPRPPHDSRTSTTAAAQTLVTTWCTGQHGARSPHCLSPPHTLPSGRNVLAGE